MYDYFSIQSERNAHSVCSFPALWFVGSGRPMSKEHYVAGRAPFSLDPLRNRVPLRIPSRASVFPLFPACFTSCSRLRYRGRRAVQQFSPFLNDSARAPKLSLAPRAYPHDRPLQWTFRCLDARWEICERFLFHRHRAEVDTTLTPVLGYLSY